MSETVWGSHVCAAVQGGALVDQVGLAIYKFRYHVYVEISSYLKLKKN